MDSFPISVIIPSYNGANRIHNLLKGLENQTFDCFETIIIIDGSTDNTVEVLKAEKFKLKKLILIEQENLDKVKTRNNGSKKASGELLIFFDDDMIPEPTCIENHFQFHKNNYNCILSGNGYRNKQYTNTDFGHYLLAIEKYWQSLHPTEYQITLDKPRMTACNLSLPKKLFDELEGFDEQLKDCEDIDMAIRALKKNTSIFYNSNIKAWHNDSPTLKTYINRLNQYNKAVVKLFDIKPEYKNYLHYEFTQKQVPLFKKMILILFKNNFFLKIDSFFEKKLIPKKIKYFSYQLIIAANSDINK